MEVAVMIKAVNDILKELTSTLAGPFAKFGYTLKKFRFFEMVGESGRTRRYTIDISKKKGWFSLHLTLQILDPVLMTRVNTVLDAALRDERLEYPDSWSESIIEKTIKTRTSNWVVAELTDWRALKNPSEPLEHFNQRFSIWLYSFDNLDEKLDWKEQLLTSIDLAQRWFDQVDSNEWICTNTDYPSFVLLNTEGLAQKLEDRYNATLKSAEDPGEVKLFYLHLSEQPIKDPEL
jgi:hypothetical protein